MDAHPNSLCLLCWSVAPTGTGSCLTHPVSHVWELPEELQLAQSRDSPLESVTASVGYLPASVETVSRAGFCVLVLTKPSHPGGQHTAGTSHQSGQCTSQASAGANLVVTEPGSGQVSRSGWKRQGCSTRNQPGEVLMQKADLCHNFSPASHVQHTGWRGSGEDEPRHCADMLLRQEC